MKNKTEIRKYYKQHMRKIIFESKKPLFAIQRDSYQWILSSARNVRDDGRIEWGENTYHPNICNLLIELAENQFKRKTKKISELKDIQLSVAKVYDLIESVSQRLASAL